MTSLFLFELELSAEVVRFLDLGLIRKPDYVEQ